MKNNRVSFHRLLLLSHLLTTSYILPLTQLIAQSSNQKNVLYGEVDLKNGQTLKGVLDYDLKNNSLQIVLDNKIKGYDITSVESFQAFDKITHKTKFFFSLPYQVNHGFYRDLIFELLTEGKLTLFSRQIPTEEYRSVYNGGRYVWANITVLKENYFFISDDSEMTACDNSLKDLMKFMADKEKEMQEFYKKNRLKLEKRTDMIKIVNHYNSISAE